MWTWNHFKELYSRELGFTELCVSLIAIVIIYWIKIWIDYRKLPPGPWGLPLLGYLPFLDPKHAYLTMASLSKQYGPIYSIRMGKILTVVLTDLKMIKRALNDDSLSGRADLFLAHGIMKGYGLIGAEGRLWKEQRKFALTFLKNYGAVKHGKKRDQMEALVMTHGVETLIRKIYGSIESELESKRTAEELDLSGPLLHLVGNVVNKIIFGRTWPEDDPIWLELQHYADEGLKKMGEAGVLNFLPFLRYLVPKYKKNYDFVVDGLKATHVIYDEIINAHDGTENDVIGAYIAEQKRRRTACDKVDRLGSFTDQQLPFLMADMFGAGVDTTVTNLTWFFLQVANHMDVQKRIQENLDEVCKEGEPCKLDDMASLPYLEAALAESQRMRSVVPMGVPHAAVTDVVLESYKVPRGTMVVPLLWAVHMDPNAFHDPQQFLVERFLDENGQYCQPESFIPFQTGKRTCLGKDFGRIMLFLFASNVLKEFTITLPDSILSSGADPLEGRFEMLLKPKITSFLFTPRNQNPSTD